MINMPKKYLLIASVILAAGVSLAEAAAPPQFGEFQIEVIKDGKPLYSAYTVLGPNADAVVEDNVQTIPMEATCKPNFTLSPPLTYKQGVKLELNANIHQGVAYGFFAFEVEAPAAPAVEAPFGQGCTARLVIGHNFGSSGGKILSVGEPSVTRINNLEVKLTLKKVYNSAPEGKELGKLIRG